MTTDGDIETAMSALLTPAPATLAPNVLAEVGLADLYARFDSPIGPLVVAWNGLGVSGRGGGRGRRHVRGQPRGADRPPDLPGRAAARRSGRAIGSPAGRRPARPDRPGPARPHRLRARRLAQGARDPAGRGPAVRLGRRRDRPPEGGPRRRHRPGAQPGPAHRALPSRRPDRRQHRPVLAGRAEEQADDPGRRGPRSGCDRGAGRRTGIALRRLGHDPHRAACRRATPRSGSRRPTGSPSGRCRARPPPGIARAASAVPHRVRSRPDFPDWTP